MAGGGVDMPILDGTTNELPPLSSKIVRVFLSSTFSDMAVERNTLMKEVYPKLQKYTRDKYGAMFQMVDMRWGVTNESQNDHMTSKVCLKEIQNCQRVSIGPNFVALIGQKYGYRPIPATIPAGEYEIIHEFLEKGGDDVSILTTWFLKDNNAIPAEYVLQPINSVLQNYDSEDEELKAKARADWAAIFDQISVLLRRGADAAFNAGKIDSKEKDKYFLAVTEEEIRHGLFDSPDEANKRCLCFMRTIADLHDNLNHPRAIKFVDLRESSPQDGRNESDIDTDAQNMLKVLRERKIPEKLRKKNIVKLATRWSKNGGIHAEDNKDYLESLCNAFLEKMMWLIDENLKHLEQLRNDEQRVEVIQSLQVRNEWSQIFFGREEILTKVQKYVCDRNDRKPFALFGESGCGKTAVIAACAKRTPEWLKQSPVTVVRFLGTTPRSSHILLMLQSLCSQIGGVYGKKDLKIPSEFPEVVDLFKSLLQLSRPDRPLTIYLDSLDQLSPTFDPHHFLWLPKTLPEHTKVIMSFIPDHKRLLSRFREEVTDDISYCIKIPQLGDVVSMEIIQARLKAANRSITKQQEEIVASLFTRCGLPLFSRIVFDEISRWKSYTEIKEGDISSTVTESIQQFFKRIESDHGHATVAHALSYITAARNGLSEVELLDLLSLDDDVLNAVFLFWVPPVRRIPPFLWTRLRLDLDKFLVHREADDTDVICWYHRQFSEVATVQYLKDPKTELNILKNLCDYFLGVWGGGKKKPFTYMSFLKSRLSLSVDTGEEDRKVPLQPLEYRQGGNKTIYNARKLSELPYHLANSRNFEMLASSCIFNYKWLIAKLRVAGLPYLLEDLHLASAKFQEKDVQLLMDTLRIAGSVLNSNVENLGVELEGRLLTFFDRSPNIRALIRQCDVEGQTESSFIVPFQLFESPLSALSQTLEGSRTDILDFVFANNGRWLISVSSDGSVKFWDVEKGEMISNIDVEVDAGIRRISLSISPDEKYLVWKCKSSTVDVKVLDLHSKEHVCQYSYDYGTAKHVLFPTRKYLCMNNAVFDIATGQKIHSFDEYWMANHFFNVVITPDESHLLYGSDNAVLMFHIESVKQVASMPISRQASVLRISSDGSYVIVGQILDCKIAVFDIRLESSTFGKKLKEYNPDEEFRTKKSSNDYYATDEVSEITFSNNGSAFAALIRYKFPTVWGMPDTKVKPVAMSLPPSRNPKRNFFQVSFSFDDKFLLAAESSPNLVMWDAKSGMLLSLVAAHSHDIHRLLVSSINSTAVTVGHGDLSIKLWDTDKIMQMGSSSNKEESQFTNNTVLAHQANMVFISRVQPLKTTKAYHFIDYFGIDVLNLTSGRKSVLLPFDKYGPFQSMAVSSDAEIVAILAGTAISSTVHVISTKDKLLESIKVGKCRCIKLSTDGKNLAVFTHDLDSSVRLYSLPDLNEIGTHENCMTGIFTTDMSFIGVTTNRELIVQETIGNEETAKMPLHADVVAVHFIDSTKTVLITLHQDGETFVTAYRTEGFGVIGTLNGISKRGICDTASDGSICIDADFQIFDTERCRLLKKLHGTKEPVQNTSDVKLSTNGIHAIFIDKHPTDCVKVCRIADSEIIATACLHCIPLSLEVLVPSNTVLVVGKDNHMYVLSLNDSSRENFANAQTMSERSVMILRTTQDAMEKGRDFQLPKEVMEAIVEHNRKSQIKSMHLISQRKAEAPEIKDISGEEKDSNEKRPKSSSCILL